MLRGRECTKQLFCEEENPIWIEKKEEENQEGGGRRMAEGGRNCKPQPTKKLIAGMAKISQEAKEEIDLLESMYPDNFQSIDDRLACNDGDHHHKTSFLLKLRPLFGDGLEHRQ
ncbi:hypothetical protein PGTUg99_034695 [Puccinia graminis f. sp. tritici]|uniref:Uncharacterized protein n=1 Tax=Puccinia graminis f. sp. tritici TaxID=56615 RepID=A0A5B0MFH1_PUCGR|nr:hypothetical protein PGTUg99_034695 [Puccinia graminis f. sp. tritici]